MVDKHLEYLNRALSCQMKIKEDLERIGDIKHDCEYQSVKDQIFLLHSIIANYKKSFEIHEPSEVDLLLDTLDKEVKRTRQTLLDYRQEIIQKSKGKNKIVMSNLYGKLGTK